MSTVELILLVLFAAGSIIVKIFAALKEQAEKKEAKRRAEQRELDNLRTGGRTTVTEARMPAQQQDAQTARAALEEMAAKRRAQIEELRRRRAASAGGVPPAPPPVQPAPTPRQRIADRPQRIPDRPLQKSQNIERQRPAPVPPRSEAERQQRNRVQQKFEQQREANEALESQQRQRSREGANRLAEDRTNAAVRAIEASAAAVRGTADTEAQQSRARELRPPRLRMVIDPRDLKRAIILQELLGPPLSLRQ